MTRFALTAAVVAALLAAGAVTAVATSGTLGGTTTARGAGSAMGKVGVRLNVSKFVKSGNALVAKGTAVATYTARSGTPTVVRHPFTARVVTGARSARSPQQQGPCPV